MMESNPSSSSEVQPLQPPSAVGSEPKGFTRTCKGLAVVLLGGYALLQVFPSAVNYLALIPARTIPFAWNLITAGYLEQVLPGAIGSSVGLLFCGKALEPVWGRKEFMKFIILVNFFTSVCAFVTAIALYYITRKESFLYTPLSGFHGVLAGFLVGMKQITPDHELPMCFFWKIKAKWMPLFVAVFSIIMAFIIEESINFLPTLLAGTYVSWIYLRYFQRKPEIGLKGDPSDEFSFSSFFPEFMRPVIEPISSLFDRVLCTRLRTSEFIDHTLPISTSTEASRRRERGERALEQRLAAERSATMGSIEVTSHGI
ncbi:rhomboid-like protein 19 [Typha angustifolia]|uniref:rhomboid-like protein 19 n=1 Tax=Typha angustifolia TaxID=59011 RepID=UPI003C2D1B94